MAKTIHDFTIGMGVYYTGDMANVSGHGSIVSLNPANRWTNGTVNIQLEDGRLIRAIEPTMFDKTPGQRFWLLTEWNAKRDAEIEQMKAEFARVFARQEAR